MGIRTIVPEFVGEASPDPFYDTDTDSPPTAGAKTKCPFFTSCQAPIKFPRANR